MTQEEQVLVVERKVIEGIGIFQGLMFQTDAYIRGIFAPGVPRFIPRPKAEKNPDFKQLIPYVIISYDGKYLNYLRGKRAGETRLVGLRSIGIGGHINPVDDVPLFNANFYQTYLAAVEREVSEEVFVEGSHCDKIVALLNDDSNEVGQVHLGIVHCWTLDSPKVERREQMITQMTFMSPAELRSISDDFETWSRICIDNLDEMTQNKKSVSPHISRAGVA